jgi:hypothetical protein
VRLVIFHSSVDTFPADEINYQRARLRGNNTRARVPFLLKGIVQGSDRRALNLTTLAPDIVTANLDETLPAEVTLFVLAAGTPLMWEVQRRG